MQSRFNLWLPELSMNRYSACLHSYCLLYPPTHRSDVLSGQWVTITIIIMIIINGTSKNSKMTSLFVFQPLFPIWRLWAACQSVLENKVPSVEIVKSTLLQPRPSTTGIFRWTTTTANTLRPAYCALSSSCQGQPTRQCSLDQLTQLDIFVGFLSDSK